MWAFWTKVIDGFAGLLMFPKGITLHKNSMSVKWSCYESDLNKQKEGHKSVVAVFLFFLNLFVCYKLRCIKEKNNKKKCILLLEEIFKSI